MPAIQYDYHIHSSFSDGNTSIRNIVERAIKLRLETIAIIDHFWPSIGSTRGGINLIKERREAIETVRGEYPQIRILEGAEVDINSDGTMAPVAGGLDQFDIVIGSIHWGSDSRLWASAVSGAADRERFEILGHWNGYLSSYRPEHGNMVAEALARNKIAVELSARYELRFEDFLTLAKDKGCKFTLGSDSHHVSDIGRLKDQSQLASALELPLIEF
ncbi:MAG: PHP domain-containing protein [Candidatus Thorarchaeota archaeon]|jgi:histidinol phosphatase-like PHP family hydrolase